jgi:hypothetical protein
VSPPADVDAPPAGDPAAEELTPLQWRARRRLHETRVDGLLAGHLARRRRGERHPVEDFLFTYYGLRPARLRRWHPGAFVTVIQDDGRRDRLDVGAYLDRRADTVGFVHRLLVATAARPARFDCLGLHEWAMVYRQGEHRHPDPLRLGQAATDAVVEANRLRCTHFDAYRFFTPDAAPRNATRPSRELQVAFEQPGCLHASMDLYKWAGKLGEAVPSELLLDCLVLARDVRVLDMRASPYDLTGWGYLPVRIETAEGRAEYVAAQRVFAARGQDLRRRLAAVTGRLLVVGTAVR